MCTGKSLQGKKMIVHSQMHTPLEKYYHQFLCIVRVKEPPNNGQFGDEHLCIIQRLSLLQR